MRNCRSEAIVLGVMDYREADRIVTLFTLDQGKLKGLARGAKRSIRRFGGALEPFSRLTVELGLTDGLARLNDADVVTVFPRIREDLLKIGYAGYACEVVALLLPEGLANPRLFRLLAAWLEQLDKAPPLSSDRRFFEINLLNILGYRPDLETCASCGTALAALQEGCHAGPAGETLCRRCGRGALPVSTATMAKLARSLRTGRFGAVEFSPGEAAEAGLIVEAAIASHLVRPLRSLNFLAEMGQDSRLKVS